MLQALLSVSNLNFFMNGEACFPLLIFFPFCDLSFWTSDCFWSMLEAALDGKLSPHPFGAVMVRIWTESYFPFRSNWTAVIFSFFYHQLWFYVINFYDLLSFHFWCWTNDLTCYAAGISLLFADRYPFMLFLFHCPSHMVDLFFLLPTKE